MNKKQTSQIMFLAAFLSFLFLQPIQTSSASYPKMTSASYPKNGDSCKYGSSEVVGYNSKSGSGTLVFLRCGKNGIYSPDNSASKIDQKTGKPITAKAIGNTSSDQITNFCQADPKVPAEWADVQSWDIANRGCAEPFRYVYGNSNFIQPKSKLTPDSQLLDINVCKLADPQKNSPGAATFPRSPNLFTPSISANFEVIPVQFSDIQANTNPRIDYGKYVDFVMNYLKNTSDVAINPNVSWIDHYLQLGNSIDTYKLGAGGKLSDQYLNDVLNASAKYFDLSNIDQLIIVGPPSTPLSKLYAYMGSLKEKNRSGRTIAVYQYNPTKLQPWIDGQWGFDPNIYVHEQLNHEMGLDDELIEYTGGWGNMAGVMGELLVWDKWLVGFVSDSQIHCVSPTTKSVQWIRPSTLHGNFLKAVIVPLSSSKGIVIESQRSYGYNYKMPKITNGVLVYEVDTTKTMNSHLDGESEGSIGVVIQSIRPKTKNNFFGNVHYGDAALKLGESIVVDGVKISVMESGDFGDVIQTSKV